MSERVDVKQKVLSENDRLAAELRQRFSDHRVVCLNLVSSPGSGKTSLLERTLTALSDTLSMAVIAGDVQTENDARRLVAAGGKIVRPITTGGACHLDARMVANAAGDIGLGDLDLLFIENVGNLVCPSSYDLGEDMKVVLISVTEGDDKPLKYPGMFRRSSVMVINKIDLLEHCDFDMDTVKENALTINGNLTMFELSCRNEQGMLDWYEWLKKLVNAKKQA
jgi:hydrogenase nickel incorporation protein HypB